MAVEISVVVPTYGEAENLPALADAIDAALRGRDYEVVVANDDSGDNTPAVCDNLARKLPWRLLNRTTNRGLSPAVIDGIGIARGEVVVVIDADLSHPPDKIVAIADALLRREADFAVGSRYVAGGGLDDDWPWWRRLNSLGATLPARLIAPYGDPMSGFFGLRRADMPPAESLSPIGYKIGLELFVKGGFAQSRVLEVPIHFKDRLHGESKMSAREQVNYLRHLRRLYHYRWPKQMEILQFLAVGLLGFVIDVLFYLGLRAVGAPHLVARAIAYWPAVTSNWFFNRIMTFKERGRRPPLSQWLVYALFAAGGFLINWGTYALLTTHITFFAEHLLLALFLGVVAGTVFNFLTSDLIIFRSVHPHNAD